MVTFSLTASSSFDFLLDKKSRMAYPIAEKPEMKNIPAAKTMKKPLRK
jgi:hypothetical protein